MARTPRSVEHAPMHCYPSGVAQPAQGQRVAGLTILDRMVADGRIDVQDRERAVLQARRAGDHALDALIDTGGIGETDLLQYLANLYRTRYVTSRKLLRARIDPDALRVLPGRLAERLNALPVALDRRNSVLVVVASDLVEQDVARQVQLVSGVRDVQVYVARPATIRALVRLHYFGDRSGLDELAVRGIGAASDADGAGAAPRVGGLRDVADPMGTFSDSGLLELEPAPPRRPAPVARTGNSDPLSAPMAVPPPVPPPRSGSAPMPPAPARVAEAAVPPPAGTIHAPEIAARLVAPQGEVVPARDHIETVNVLVALLERERGELRGHSAHTARLVRKMGERMRLPQAQVHAVQLAAYLHDIGKTSAYHLTALNVHQYEGHRLQAARMVGTPARLFEAARLPTATVEALEHMYERWDGQGLPGKLRGKDIPLGARLLAIAESYTDLTANSRNPFRRVLHPKEACEALARHRETFFDPDLVDLLRVVALGEDLARRLLADRPTVLVVDPDAEETSVLELRLLEQGWDVALARTSHEARERVARGGVDVVVSEVDLEPVDGFELLRALREQRPELPLVFLTRRADGDSVRRGFDLGAADYVLKPAAAELVLAKLQRVLADAGRARPARGVTGSLREMALPDVVQVLTNGRKSGRLEIATASGRGTIDFVEGAIWDARFGPHSGPDALYAMLRLQDGTFALDPAHRAERRTVHESAEALLLEGMRRLDEGIV
ncbi:MAG: DUF4388 domain-containing protein [Myxococcota bacterium]|nr:DUF4388 domain-containing protein [Myxococcota bacterium]MDW8363182.1 DUF4388 domain-containing protein [Myxococcales bacterium]